MPRWPQRWRRYLRRGPDGSAARRSDELRDEQLGEYDPELRGSPWRAMASLAYPAWSRALRWPLVQRATGYLVRSLESSNGLSFDQRSKGVIRERARVGYDNYTTERSPRGYMGVVEHARVALAETLPVTPGAGGLHPPVEPTLVDVPTVQAAWRSICPLWPFC